MATLNVFTITNTAGTPISAIQPNTLDGPGGVQQSSDLSMFGLGYALWGQSADQNDYRLNENHACPDMSGYPSSPRYAALSAAGTLHTTPASSIELGFANGINVPLKGQTWYNTTTNQLLVYNGLIWVGFNAVVILSATTPAGTNGDLWYNTNTGVLYVYNGSWVSANSAYLPLSGGTMSGTLNMAGAALINAAISSSTFTGGTTIGTTLRGSGNGTANQIVIPAVDNPYIGTNPANIIYTPATLPATASPFVSGMIMGWKSPTPPTGWYICDGTNGTPDLRNKFIIGAGSTYPYGQTGGATTAAVSVTVPQHNHGGTTGATALTVAQMPQHGHDFWCSYGTQPSGGGAHYDLVNPQYFNTALYPPGSTTPIISLTGGGQTHDHTIANQAAATGTGTVSIVPPYYGLYWIMKS